jgi:hypothetical protein
MASYLTQSDLANFGPELLDVAQRAAQHAVGPELQQLRDENRDLQEQLSSAAKLALDRELDAAVPNWREINVSEQFHRWLSMPEPYSGIIRDRLLKDATAAVDPRRVIRFFQGFLREAGQPVQPGQPVSVLPGRYPPVQSSGRQISRDQILQMASLRRQGKIDDQTWARWERELFAAGREGRIPGALDADGCQMGPR